MELFFPASRHAADQITTLFEFVWPTAAALWNLRWQVQGFVAEVPNATVDQLKQRFLFGSKIDNVDLKRTVKDYSWDDQTAIFASFVLTNAFAIYEQWADEILHSLGEGTQSGKKLQFPAKVVTIMGTLLASTSPTLNSAYHPVFAAGKKYALAQLPNLMLCYRYFKELSVLSGPSVKKARQCGCAAAACRKSNTSFGLILRLASPRIAAWSMVPI